MFASKDTLLTRPSGYNIARSVRLRSSATASFNRTFTTGDTKTWTWSAWVKRGTMGAINQYLFALGSSQTYIIFNSDNIQVGFYSTNASTLYYTTTSQVFRDPSAWYHIVVAIDTTQATAANRNKLYVNGVQVTAFSAATYPSQNDVGQINTAAVHRIGSYDGSSNLFDGYLTEINFVNAQQLTPSSFGETDSITGVWKPKKYGGTYGTNGFYLNFSDNSNNTAATIGKDYSGNGNNWTPNNISVTAGVTYDSMTDVCTLTSATAANYAVLSPLWPSSVVSGGNLNIVGDSNSRTVVGSITEKTGKWYAEGTFTSGYSVNGWFFVWDTSTPYVYGNLPATTGQTGAYYRGTNGDISKNVTGTTTSIGTYSTWTNGDIIGMAFDADAGTISFYKNNTLQVTITDSAFIGRPLTFGLYYYAGNASMNFGQRPFTYTPPAGFVALNTYNLPASTITNGAAYMAATTYTGTGAALTVSNAVNGVSFQPDWVWVKGRSGATDHALYDSVRGVQKQLESNQTGAETTETTGLTAFGSTGFTVGALAQMNTSSATYVGWQWKAGTTSASNTNGTITSTVSAGATQGFSVVTYTGNGTAGATIGHGLGVAPSLIIPKTRTGTAPTNSWHCYHASLGATKGIVLNSTAGQTTDGGFWNNTAPTSSVITLGTYNSYSAQNYVAYCFSAVAGYSAFGSYTGNGSNDGPFVYTGFRPRWVLVKNSSQANDWFLMDSSMNTYNVIGDYLHPNTSSATVTFSWIDFLSNGFKIRSTSTGLNNSSIVQIYAAFAENPFKNALAR